MRPLAEIHVQGLWQFVARWVIWDKRQETMCPAGPKSYVF